MRGAAGFATMRGDPSHFAGRFRRPKSSLSFAALTPDAAGLPARKNRQQRSEASGNATNYAGDQPAAGLTPFAFPPGAGGRLHNGPRRETACLAPAQRAPAR